MYQGTRDAFLKTAYILNGWFLTKNKWSIYSETDFLKFDRGISNLIIQILSDWHSNDLVSQDLQQVLAHILNQGSAEQVC